VQTGSISAKESEYLGMKPETFKEMLEQTFVKRFKLKMRGERLGDSSLI
jgi:hypothetical protein